MILADWKVIEHPVDGASLVTIQAAIRTPVAPSLSALTCEALRDGTLRFSALRILEATDFSPSNFVIRHQPGWIRVGLTVPVANRHRAIEIIASLFDEPRFDPELVRKSMESMPFRSAMTWEQAIDPWKFELTLPRRTTPDEAVRQYWKSLIRLEGVTIVIAGGFKPGSLKSALVDIMPYPATGSLPADEKAVVVPWHHGEAETLEVRGPVFYLADPIFGAKALLAVMLGVGKSGALYRIARENLGWSYRQECVVSPVGGGFALRLVLAGKSGTVKQPEQLSAALLDDSKTWTEDDLKRAKGLFVAIINDGYPFSPFYWDGTASLHSLADDAYSRALLLASDGPVSLREVVSAAEGVSLDELKAELQSFLKGSALLQIKGR